jgi:tetratricopeptide (TPR) repeat protein
MPSDGRPSQPAAPKEGDEQRTQDISLSGADDQPAAEGTGALKGERLAAIERAARMAPPPPPRVQKRAPPRPTGFAIPPVGSMVPPAGSIVPPLPAVNPNIATRTPSQPGVPRPSNDVSPRTSETLRPQPTPTGQRVTIPEQRRSLNIPEPRPTQPDQRMTVPDPRHTLVDGPSEMGRRTMVDLPQGGSSLGAPEPLAPPGPPPTFVEAARQLVARCEAELLTNPPPARLARLHYEIARLSERPLSDARKASTHYQQAFDRAPDHLPTIRGLRRTLIVRRALKQALPLFDAEARLTSDPAVKARLFFAKGRLLEDGLALRADAQRTYRAALDLAPNDPTLLKALEQCDQAGEEWAELAHTYARQANAAAADPKQRAALLIRRAQVLETRLSDPEGAIAQYETALELDGGSLDAVEALKRLYYARSRFRDLVRVLELEAELSRDPRLRTAALYAIARIFADKLGNRPDAIDALSRALEYAPHDRLLLEELAQLKEAAREYRGLVAVLSSMVEALGEAPDRTGVLHRIGQICDEHLADPEQARGWFERALMVDPGYVPALQALGNLYASSGNWQALIAMHLSEAEATNDSQRRAAAHARIAEVLETKLGQMEAALEHHARALSAVPIYAPSFKALTRLYAKQRRHRELIELYERAVEHADAERAIAYLLKIGALYEDALGDPVQALHAYQRVLDREPRHLGAIHALQRATEAAGRYTDLVEVLVLEADLSANRAHRVALLCRAGEVLDEQLNDRESAITMLKRVVQLDARYVPALATLGRMYYRAGRWEDLLQMYHAELSVAGDDPRAVTLLLKMGELTEQKLGRPSEATELYRRAAQLDPASSTAQRAYARKLREQGKWDELIDVLSRELKSATDPKERASAYFRLGEVYEFRLERPDSALDCYEKALLEDRNHRAAHEAEVRLRAARGDYAKLTEDLSREVEHAEDPARRIASLMQLGELLRDHMRDLRRAVACFEEVLTIDPAHHGALLALEALYRKTNQWTELSSVLAAESRYFADVEARTTALRELARLGQRNEADHETTRASYEAILSLAPTDMDALTSLETLALSDDDPELLMSVDARVIDGATDRALKAAHLTRLAELCEGDDPTRALALYRAALENDPENLSATRGLSRLAERTEDAEVLAQAARREADVMHDERASAELWVRSALADMRARKDERSAAAKLERALELDPDNARAAYYLTECLLRAGEVQRLSDLLARAASSANDKARSAALWREVARLYADEQDNVAGAISALNRSLRHTPDDVYVLGELAQLFRRDGQWNEAANLLTRVVAMTSDENLLRAAESELATIFDERLGDAGEALVHMRAALKLSPEDPGILERLSDLLSREGEHAEAVTIGQRLVDVSRNPDARVNALLNLSRIEQRRGDKGGAVRALIDAVALDGPGGGPGQALREAVGSFATAHDYAAALRKHIQTLRGGAGAPADVYLELARVQADEIDAKNDALGTLREAIARQPGNLSLRVEHAKLLRAVGAFDECSNELRLLLLLDVERLQTWRDLAECFGAMNRPDPRLRALEALRVLGVRSGENVSMRPELTRIRPGAMSGGVLDELSFDLVPFGAAGELLVSLIEGLDKLYPPDLDGYGVSSRDRLNPRSGHPFRSLAERIAEIVGCGEFELYVHRSRTRGAGVELAEKPILMMPAWLLEQSDAHQVFMLTRALVLAARNCHAVLKLTHREIEVLLAAYARTVVPGFGRGLTSEELLEEQSRRVHRALSRKARKSAEEAVHKYVSQDPPEFVKWTESRERLATRAAALLTDDLVATMESLARTRDTRDSSVDLRDDSIKDLLRFWVSEAAFRARGRIRS